jgi:hypothetical protein
MAARTLRPRHQDEIRDKIQTTQLIKKLENHALNDDGAKISASRMKAIEILLRKSLPDLSSVEIVGTGEGGEIKHAVEITIIDVNKA